MARVYRWMFAGLGITAATSIVTVSSEALLASVLQLFYPLLIGELVLVLAFSFLAHRVSGAVAALMFLGYAFLTGLTFSVLFLAYELGSIGQAFAVTAGGFGALSFYGTVTKKDLSGWRTFLMMGLFGVVIAGAVQLFVRSPMLDFVWSFASVIVFAGLTAYDTQKLRQFHASSGYSSAASLAINGALILYLDFINLFLAILRLLGRRR
ncbi:MAG: Bax inhibitor-1/YccA family protein [Myxococcales bacterium]|nr:Bax inhibitor-1/YccA family protein [Myxococcales bacterium]